MPTSAAIRPQPCAVCSPAPLATLVHRPIRTPPPTTVAGSSSASRSPTELPPWLSAAELDHYVAEFERTGFTGGLSWYRNLDRNWELTPQLDGAGWPSRRCSSAAATTPCC